MITYLFTWLLISLLNFRTQILYLPPIERIQIFEADLNETITDFKVHPYQFSDS